MPGWGAVGSKVCCSVREARESKGAFSGIRERERESVTDVIGQGRFRRRDEKQLETVSSRQGNHAGLARFPSSLLWSRVEE